MKSLPISLALFLLLFLPLQVSAQQVARSNKIQAECGSIIEGEFSQNFQEDSYSITLNPGDAVESSVLPLGAGLQTGIILSGPTNLTVSVSDGSIENDGDVGFNSLLTEPRIITEALSARGDYTIRVVNFAVSQYYVSNSRDEFRTSDPGGIGVYTLFIGCTLRDGNENRPRTGC